MQEILTAIVVTLAVLFLVARWTNVDVIRKWFSSRKPDVKTSSLLRKKKPKSSHHGD